MNPPQHRAMSAQIAAALRRACPDIMAAYLYGSSARGDDRPDSDIDIGVLLPPGQNLPDKLALGAKLHDITGRQIDLVDLRKVGNFLRMEVLREGQQLCNADPTQVLAWEARAMSEYAQHRTDIQGIMQDFQRSGIGYHR